MYSLSAGIKKPESPGYVIRDIPNYPKSKHQARICPRFILTNNSGRSSDSRVILILSLPIHVRTVAYVQKSSPVTAAGPSSICTKFPFYAQRRFWRRIRAPE